MSFTGDLLAGVAGYLAASGVGVYNPTAGYTAAQVGIVFYGTPANPPQVIVLAVYRGGDDPTQPESEVGLQVRVRGDADPRTADDLDDRVFDTLQNLPRTVLGGITVTGCFRQSTAYLGVDGNGRHEKASNYRLLAGRPTPNRT